MLMDLYLLPKITVHYTISNLAYMIELSVYQLCKASITHIL